MSNSLENGEFKIGDVCLSPNTKEEELFNSSVFNLSTKKKFKYNNFFCDDIQLEGVRFHVRVIFKNSKLSHVKLTPVLEKDELNNHSSEEIQSARREICDEWLVNNFGYEGETRSTKKGSTLEYRFSWGMIYSISIVSGENAFSSGRIIIRYSWDEDEKSSNNKNEDFTDAELKVGNIYLGDILVTPNIDEDEFRNSNVFKPSTASGDNFNFYYNDKLLLNNVEFRVKVLFEDSKLSSIRLSPLNVGMKDPGCPDKDFQDACRTVCDNWLKDVFGYEGEYFFTKEETSMRYCFDWGRIVSKSKFGKKNAYSGGYIKIIYSQSVTWADLSKGELSLGDVFVTPDMKEDDFIESSFFSSDITKSHKIDTFVCDELNIYRQMFKVEVTFRKLKLSEIKLIPLNVGVPDPGTPDKDFQAARRAVSDKWLSKNIEKEPTRVKDEYTFYQFNWGKVYSISLFSGRNEFAAGYIMIEIP